METFVVIIVLVLLCVLLGGAGYFFVREAGPENAKLWLTSPLQLRQLRRPSGLDLPRVRTDDSPSATASSPAETPRSQEYGLMLDDAKLRELAEELRGELTRAAGMTRDFDTRLTRMEADLEQTRHLPDTFGSRFDDVGKALSDVEVRVQKRVRSLRSEFRQTRKADSPYGQRRCEALMELYNRLAKVDSALAAVVNPMLLPGEKLAVPDPLYDDTLEWDNWALVGDRSFSFAESFNENRLLLDEDLADTVEAFIATMRSALTDAIYPAVQNPLRSPAQKQAMREGLERIVSAIPPVRRDLETAYRDVTRLRRADDDDDDDLDD